MWGAIPKNSPCIMFVPGRTNIYMPAKGAGPSWSRFLEIFIAKGFFVAATKGILDQIPLINKIRSIFSRDKCI